MRISYLKTLAIVSVVGNAVFGVVVAAFSLGGSRLDPSWHFVSEYALGGDGGFMELAFAALSVGGVALTLGLVAAGRSSVGPRLRGRSLPILLWGVGAGIAGIWRTDPAGITPAEATLHGQLHNLGAGLAFFAVLVAMLLLAPAWRRDARWAGLVRPSRVVAVAGALALVWFFSPFDPGLGQRAFLLLAIGWLCACAGRLITADRHAGIPAQSG